MGASLWLYRVLGRAVLPAAAGVLWVGDRLRGKSRPRWRDRLGRDLPAIEPGGLWIQAVSVGEVEAARRLVAELDQRRPGLPLVVTATTATGLDLARRTLGRRCTVAPCPLDLGRPLDRMLDAARPRVLVLVETELWPEMLHRAARRGIPAAVVNARLSSEAFRRYRRVRRLLAPLLAPITLVLARGAEDGERFRALGVPADRVRVAGNVKYDLEPDPEPLEWTERLERLAAGRPILVAGSTMEGEEATVMAAASALRERLFPVVAPRHPERFDAVARRLAERGIAVARRSRPDDGGPADLLLLDTIGELARTYRHADIAFIGGSLVPTGGHNPLEPAVWGVPVLSGGYVDNFREIYDDLRAAGACRLVGDGAALTSALDAWVDDPCARQTAGDAALRVIQANRGAVERIVDELLSLVSGNR